MNRTITWLILLIVIVLVGAVALSKPGDTFHALKFWDNSAEYDGNLSEPVIPAVENDDAVVGDTSTGTDTGGGAVDVDVSDMIVLGAPTANASITSPLTITGEARGGWYFEATFPVILTNWDGLIIAEGYAEAEGDWMTEEFVPFSATLTFEKPDFGENGFLILQKANASGLPEHDAALEIPINFE